MNLKLQPLAELLRKLGIPPAEIDRIITKVEQALHDQAAEPLDKTPPVAAAGGSTGGTTGTASPPQSAASADSQANGAHCLSAAALAANPAIAKYGAYIAAASAATGLKPELIGTQIWAESRGDNGNNTPNRDGTRDMGLMQFGQEHWLLDCVPALTPADRNNIMQATHCRPEDLDMSKPADNITGGAFHCLELIRSQGSMTAGLNYNVAGSGATDPTYVHNVNKFMGELGGGVELTQDAGS